MILQLFFLLDLSFDKRIAFEIMILVGKNHLNLVKNGEGNCECSN